MTSEATSSSTGSSGLTDQRSLAASLAPALVEACDDRLTDISWFKADWQRGGAATATADYRTDDGDEPAPVVLKLPVNRRELLWLRRLQQDGAGGRADPVVPRLYACGDAIGDYDLTWVVMERFPHGPLGLHWDDGHVERIADAAARFHADTAEYQADGAVSDEPWEEELADAVEALRVNSVPDERRWTKALKEFRGKIDDVAAEWRGRGPVEWLHGDLHLANAMSRVAIDHGPVTLIDLAEVHVGHWIEDAVYLERQLWTRPDLVRSAKPVKAVAAARRTLGLPVDDDYPRLALIRRALLAATAPRFLRSEGLPTHLASCLEWLERALDELK